MRSPNDESRDQPRLEMAGPIEIGASCSIVCRRLTAGHNPRRIASFGVAGIKEAMPARTVLSRVPGRAFSAGHGWLGDGMDPIQNTQSGADFGLSGKVAVVTGGTDGIGFGIAEALAAAGAKVVVASRRAEMCQRAEEALTSGGAESLGVPTDVTSEETIANLFSQTTDRFGGVDILVNCAGGSFSDKFRRARLLELSGDDLIEAYRLNVVSSFLCSSVAYPLMQSRGGGSIINVSSVGGESTGPAGMFAAYSASKAALNHLTRSLASEFAPLIRVNAVLPGLIDTPRTSAARTPEQTASQVSNIALGRIGRPDDVASTVLFLASPLASWITGALWRVDGGGGLVPGTGR